MRKYLLSLSYALLGSIFLSGCFLTISTKDTTPLATPEIEQGDMKVDENTENQDTINENIDIAKPSEILTPSMLNAVNDLNFEITKVTINSSNFKFDKTNLEVKPGETIELTLNNIEGFHDLVIDELNVKTKQINGAGTDVVKFTIPTDTKSGTTYEYYCSVGQHRQMGMVGTLKIV